MPTRRFSAKYEATGTSYYRIIFFAGALFLMAFLFLIVASADVQYAAPLSTNSLKQPALQADPAQDLMEMQATENAILNSYGWVDKNAAIVRIPIYRAIDLVAEKGLPVRDK
ncbi:MAG TPA: hypothetical protein G4N96_01010 [Chloroflexi bacterium]|nr:MAG: hypothetical protein B6243_00095 [Anaerolineaceae bacterium 4572_5.2]HEY83681.1 hypothetical protein [Chloroflexota bacterium]